MLCGLEYAYALDDLKGASVELCKSDSCNSEIQYAEDLCSEMNPSTSPTAEKQFPQPNGSTHNDDLSLHSDDVTTFVNSCCNVEGNTRKYNLGGLTWGISINEKMEDYLLYWIGQDNSAFANIALTFNKCDIVRYDTIANQLSRDVSHLMKILRRRYYLVEKAKDANIIGILVGTLGVAGYLNIIEQMKDLIKAAGKKSYTLVMGRPNSAKLANFPECEVFVYVSCAQTALLDSKEFLAPVITPFEAVLAFSRGREWTGEYLLDFKELITSEKPEVGSKSEEARFSFIKGGYVEDDCPQDDEENSVTSLALADVTEKALSIRNQNNDAILYQGGANSAIEYLKARSYRGLTGEYQGPVPDSVLIGRAGRAAGYSNEKTNSSQ